MYIVSMCLLGENCKYNGGNNRDDRVAEFLRGRSYFGVCPEMDGGLPVPRPKSEIVGGLVLNEEGQDVTDCFRRGAEASWNKAVSRAESLGEEIEAAILQPRSPSCGISSVYDGTFSGKLISGRGVAAAYFADKGVRLMAPDELQESENPEDPEDPEDPENPESPESPESPENPEN